jgi:hypothetical protein
MKFPFSNRIPNIGRNIPWEKVINHAFRVVEFDRNGTTIDSNNQVKAGSFFKPYGYLIVESPILDKKAKLPIIHKDDFFLASSVFDEPSLVNLVTSDELLVTYAPKVVSEHGLSGNPDHVLHYAIKPHGTLDSYYTANNSIYKTDPDPQKLFGPFVYEGEIRVLMNPSDKFRANSV